MAQGALAFAAGLLFALGLGLSGMTRPSKVLGFLDLSGTWDPSLLFVMIGAIAVYATAYRLVMRRARPLAAPRFDVPPKRPIDRRLVFGALLFGGGWGLGGYCPGPALVGVATGVITPIVFVASMLAGVLAHAIFQKRRAPVPPRSPRNHDRIEEDSGANQGVFRQGDLHPHLRRL